MAKLSSINPWPKIKLKGKRRSGIIYQTAVGRYLIRQMNLQRIRGELIQEQWLEFYDANGRGYAQPDHYIIMSGKIVLIECKLTATIKAYYQMTDLYRPLLRHIYDLPVTCVQICKVLRRDLPSKEFLYTLNGVIDYEGKNPRTWHLLL